MNEEIKISLNWAQQLHSRSIKAGVAMNSMLDAYDKKKPMPKPVARALSDMASLIGYAESIGSWLPAGKQTTEVADE